ncbi:MAG: ATP-binding protein [Synergistaceae bacterium]|jgi:predicted AAA+ superfamily ATPase|nr:ATP-binding protein [Synergistaceae bacterium]
MKNRDIYLRQLTAFKDTSPVKVVTGVRRCGKSTLLDLYERHLRSLGASAILRMNFESLEFEHIKTYRDLYAYIKAWLRPEAHGAEPPGAHAPTAYILLDEVQQVEGWERAVNSLRLERGVDLYVTGSNARLLSSELSPLLSGRYVEIKMLPLSFAEFMDFNGYPREEADVRFNDYLKRGSFPGVTELRDNPTAIEQLVEGIYDTIIMKDVIMRNSVRDAALLDGVVRFLCASVGNFLSTKKISGYLTSAGRKTSAETIDSYVRMLEDAFFIYRARRYDLKGHMHLKTQEKFYVVDTGIRRALVGAGDYGFLLENVVYLELLRRGYRVSVGKLGSLEVDFVAAKGDRIVYYQVTASALDKGTRERELAPLRRIPDHHEKVLLSMDRTPISSFDGIRNVNIVDFLLGA